MMITTILRVSQAGERVADAARHLPVQTGRPHSHSRHSRQSLEGATIILPIFQQKQPRHRKVMTLPAVTEAESGGSGLDPRPPGSSKSPHHTVSFRKVQGLLTPCLGWVFEGFFFDVFNTSGRERLFLSPSSSCF